MVARAGREDPGALAREAAAALAAFSSEPAGLLTACRALVGRQPTCGPVWWLAARVLAAADPSHEAWVAADELYSDPTSATLAAALPDEVTVVALGWPDQVAGALASRGDVRALVVDALDEGGPLVNSLRRRDGDAELVPESGMGAAVRAADLVLLEARALGGATDETGAGFVALAGSAAAAATARQSGVPVWAVAGTGRLLPPSLWEALVERLLGADLPWDSEEEIVPLAWVDAVAGPGGVESVEEALAGPSCPPAPELARFARQ
jgi:hypothetical protein